MAERRPLTLINGIISELPVGDTTAGATGGSGSGASYAIATIDFGVTPASSATVLVTGLTGLTVAKHKDAFVQADDSTAGNTVNAHRLLAYWGRFTCEYVSATSMNIHCDLLVGLASGTFKIHYAIS